MEAILNGKTDAWRRRIDDQRASRQSIRAWCAANDTHEHTFYWWRSRLGLSLRQRPLSLPRKAKTTPPAFARVILNGTQRAAAEPGKGRGRRDHEWETQAVRRPTGFKSLGSGIWRFGGIFWLPLATALRYNPWRGDHSRTQAQYPNRGQHRDCRRGHRQGPLPERGPACGDIVRAFASYLDAAVFAGGIGPGAACRGGWEWALRCAGAVSSAGLGVLCAQHRQSNPLHLRI